MCAYLGNPFMALAVHLACHDEHSLKVLGELAVYVKTLPWTYLESAPTVQVVRFCRNRRAYSGGGGPPYYYTFHMEAEDFAGFHS
jgi:hypothetical protein